MEKPKIPPATVNYRLINWQQLTAADVSGS